MEHLKDIPLGGRYHSDGNFDPRFIMEVIKEIDAGLPALGACAKYNLRYGTVRRWLREPQFRYGGLKRKLLSVQEKRSIARSVVQEGLSYKAASVAFQVSIAGIRKWIKEFEKENDELGSSNPQDLTKKKTPKQTSTQNDEELRQLKKELADAQLKIAALNTLIDVAEEQLKIDIRKKPGARQS